ncbi:DUF6631 family protein [Halomonas stenophila]|uniref:Uncharacterized protein n=1 Tax=Halomonas stenophila TaxID=795312 RepID=A0A7W5HLZ5_9GAMM|nr:DUF6631 family protein [Halomonas stenophila]MBB3231703.1 hypothetical protein [Halomonas stenophila]
MSDHRPEQDPEILFPDETLRIGGEKIRVREFRYAEGLRAIALGRPILAALREHLEADDIEPEVLDGVIAEHSDAWLQLIAMSIGKDVAWVEQLADADGLSLSMAFWRVNSAFFMRRLVLGGGLAGGLKSLAANLSPSPRSSTPSSMPATDATPPTSPAD